MEGCKVINADRIVPVTGIDLISLYGLILKQDSNNATLDKLTPSEGMGAFKVTSGSKPLLAVEPAKVINIDATASSVSACTVYFVPDYNYQGFQIDGVAVTATGTVTADGKTLYKAVLDTGVITVTAAGF